MKAISHEDFSDKLQSSFDLIDEQGQSLSVVLEKIERFPAQRITEGFREPFGLIFVGTHGVLCPQGNYLLRHVSGWDTPMFIVPVAERPDGAYVYQAIYN